MSKFIKIIVDRIQLANRKGLSPYYTPEAITEEVHAESMNIWKKYIDEFERTQKMSMFMDPFRGKETINLTTGAGTLVTSKGHYKAGVLLPTSEKPVDIVSIAQWGDKVNHSVSGPDADNPIIRIDNADVVVRPTSITQVIVHFVKKPTKPLYDYTVSGEDYIYQDGTSTDFEWGEELHDEIVNRVLANLGVAQREASLVQYSNLEQQKENR